MSKLEAPGSATPAGRERGFTLIELMVAVAVVGILAAIAIPLFSGTSRRAKAGAETRSYFQDLRTRMVEYQQERGVYPPTLGEAEVHPANPGAQRKSIFPLPAAWTALRVRPTGSTDVYCGYTWATGLANDGGNAGAIATAVAPNGFGFRAPATSWYYLLAKCNLDGAPGFSYYFTDSVDPTIRTLNEGS
jgi:prepilin-type N-terminal cleavage/methylation domain-containing protein